MRIPTFKTRSLVVTVSIGGLVLLYAFLVFLPTSRAIAKMRSTLDAKRQFIVAAQKDYTEIGAIQADLERTNGWVDAWQQNSPQRNNLGGFFGRLAEISRESGANIERITPRDLAEMNALSRHPVSLVVGGSFTELFAFIQAVEQMPFTVWIDRLELKSPSQTSEELSCELSLAVFTDNRDISEWR
jgi:Tfp pilus assembly protein PilO